MNAQRASLYLCAGIWACAGSTAPGGTPRGMTAVDVRDNSFSPAAITVDAGSPVTWTWRGAAGHNVTFEDGQGSSATQAAGTHQRTFAAPGSYRYRCTIHSTSFAAGMVGAVTVD